MQHNVMTQRCTGIGLRELLDHSHPFITGSRAPWSTPRALRVVAQRRQPEMLHRIGRVVLPDAEIDMAALRAWAHWALAHTAMPEQ